MHHSLPPSDAIVPQDVALFDARPFFEKALQYGVQHGILNAQKLETIANDAPKGMVQIARYFGTEYLRPELELAKTRIINLVSLYLEHSTGGDMRLAAESLRDNSFMSRSKAGSDMLKTLIAMPQNSHFGMHEPGGFADKHIPLLAQWSLKSLPDYQAELAKRSAVAYTVEAALWLADYLGMDADALDEAAPDAEAVVRTAVLVLACQRTEMPDWVAFDKMVLALRKKFAVPKNATQAAAPVLRFTLPHELPPALKSCIENIKLSVFADLPKILDTEQPTRKLFDQTPAFMGRYFWIEDGLSAVENFDRTASAAWHKVTDGRTDDSSLLTLFLNVAAANTPKTVLTEKTAATLVRKIRKTGLQPLLASRYIEENAPAQHQQGYTELWHNFLEEAQPLLCSDRDDTLRDAISLLRRECNVSTASSAAK